MRKNTNLTNHITPYLTQIRDEVKLIRDLDPEKLGDIIQFAAMHILETDKPNPFVSWSIITCHNWHTDTPYGANLCDAFSALTGGYSLVAEINRLERDPEYEILIDWINIVNNPDRDPYIAHAIDTGTMVLEYIDKCDTEDAAKAFYSVLKWLTGYETLDEVLFMHS